MEETNLENFDQRLYEEFLDYARGIMIQFGINTEIEVNYYYKKFFIEGSIVILPDARSRMESKAYAWYYASYHPSEIDYDSFENMISWIKCQQPKQL
ncbi:uncharacterized protein OCT59_025167 [Rhizophagus irregularis]|uniref:uncharacterized protein n=1 Tax=Rhizophagus irregularis TaxID=588596 RepID=UPI00332E2A8A|nr:hypothetical protein OCT59_025167 [Rhizophagus irregularis]